MEYRIVTANAKLRPPINPKTKGKNILFFLRVSCIDSTNSAMPAVPNAMAA